MPQKHRAYISIGSNLGDPLQQVKDALPMIAGVRDTRMLRCSSLYKTEAVGGPENQQDYINAAVEIETSLSAEDLLLELQAIEYAFYRNRREEAHWGPRTMDLDILLFDQQRQQDSHLTLPHPEIANRLFVLVPLMEVAGDLYLAGYGSLSYLIEQAPQYGLQRLP